MSSLKDDILAAMRGQKPHPFPRAPGLHVIPTYVVREDELMQLIAEMSAEEVCLMCEGQGRYPSGKICETCLGKGTIPKEWNE